MVFRMGYCQFAGATQLLSASGHSSSDVQNAADSMAWAVDGKLPEQGSQVASADSFHFRGFRTPTKQLLCGLANSLQQALPQGFTLKSCRPLSPLKPAGPHAMRCRFTPLEMQAQGLSEDAGERYFTFDPESQTSLHDYYLEENFYHLVLTADEGTEARPPTAK